MLNSHCNNNDKNIFFKKISGQLGTNPYCSKGYMDSKSTMLSTRLWSSMQMLDNNICYMQQVARREKDWLFPSTVLLSFSVAVY